MLDPLEDFDDVNVQLFADEADNPSPNPKHPNMGFVINYGDAVKAANLTNIPVEIMEPFSSDQLPVISASRVELRRLRRMVLLRAQRYLAQPLLLPCRHIKRQRGQRKNPQPLRLGRPQHLQCPRRDPEPAGVFTKTPHLPALTGLMFLSLWPFALSTSSPSTTSSPTAPTGASPSIPSSSPASSINPNDEHPPHDVVAGEQFLYAIWQAVSQSPAWPETLLMITYDEHGGTYDHVLSAVRRCATRRNKRPGPAEDFTFNRFGVRVPTILVSPWIQAGTVFRSPTTTPYDHTSMLATLRDWLAIPADKMLTSARIAAAPTLEQVLTLPQARTDIPNIPPPPAEIKATATFKEPTPIQKSLVSAYAVQQGKDPAAVLSTIQTRQDAINYFQSNPAPTPPAAS